MHNTVDCEQILSQNKLIPVVVLNDETKAFSLAEALLSANIKIMEITLRTPNALAIIKKISELIPEMTVGAGTVINEDQYHLAVSNGAKFIVSPGLTNELINVASTYDIPFLPGAITPSEIMFAQKFGFKYLKFFPAESFNGTQTLKSLASPFSDIKFCPTGGINLNNIKEYLSLSNVVAAGCSFLTPENLIASGDFEQITKLALQAQALITN
jgi:2-dehydro-3-deoxyphosphogluconate aldolase / (4S)-4-hydroxy-2-oxoglutarate aldolase